MKGTNTYSGNTTVIASKTAIGSEETGGGNNNVFGTSTITVETGGDIGFSFSSNETISNPIIIDGASDNTFNYNSLEFSSDSAGSPVIITVPHITLNGNAKFVAEDANVVPNITGVTANGHCVEYDYSYANGPSVTTPFTGGPVGCVVTTDTTATPTAPANPVAAPKAPDTGFGLVAAHPAETLGLSGMSAVGLLLIGLRSRRSLKRR